MRFEIRFHRIIFFLVIFIALNPAVADNPSQELTVLDEPKPAPDFSLQDIHGKTHTLSDYRDQVLIVNFWATWCPPCVDEMPSLERAQARLRQDNVQIIAINAGESPKAIEDFIEKFSVKLPLLIDNDMKVASAWSVIGLPTTYIVDPKGYIVSKVMGTRDWDQRTLLQKIRNLNGQSQP
jgi:peroxiredoxin